MEKGVILQQGTLLQEIPIEIIDEINKKHKGEVITAELVKKIEKKVKHKEGRTPKQNLPPPLMLSYKGRN